MRRHRLKVALLALGVIAGVGGAIAFGVVRASSAARAIDVEIFHEPATFCGVLQEKTFTTRVQDVVATEGPGTLQADAAALSAGFVRRGARLKDTPAPLRKEIQSLAQSIEATVETHDFTGAEAGAEALDREARRSCR